MKRPILSEFDRMVLRYMPKSFSAAILRLSLAVWHLERDIAHPLKPIIEPIVNKLNKALKTKK